MSTPIGTEANFIDTQDVSVENVTDGNIYTQVLAVQPYELDHKVEINYLTNDAVEKLFSMTDAKVEVRLALTEPEYVALATLAIPVGATLPLKNWRVTFTSQSGNPATISGEASMANFKHLDTGLGLVEVVFRLEFMSGATVAVIVVT